MYVMLFATMYGEWCADSMFVADHVTCDTGSDSSKTHPRSGRGDAVLQVQAVL
jgi:hypothetical protein